MADDVSSFEGGTSEVLGHGQWLSPISLTLCVAICILFGIIVFLMTPGGRRRKRKNITATGTCLCGCFGRP